MDKTNNQKAARYFTENERRAMIEDYLSSNCSKSEIWRKYTGMPDHVHILIGIKPDKSISDLVRDVKSHSSSFIREQGFVKGRFEWQEGFGAFSVSQSQVPKLILYIQNQELHHKKQSFLSEYLGFLKAYEIDFKPEYLFEPIT
jgi:putative transposase